MKVVRNVCRPVLRTLVHDLEIESFSVRGGPLKRSSAAVRHRPVPSTCHSSFLVGSKESSQFSSHRSNGYLLVHHYPRSTTGHEFAFRANVHRRRGMQDMRLGPWALQLANMQTSASSGAGDRGDAKADAGKCIPHAADMQQEQHSSNSETNSSQHSETGASGEMENPEDVKRRLSAVRSRIREAGLDAREDARDWIRDKRDDIDEIREVCGICNISNISGYAISSDCLNFFLLPRFSFHECATPPSTSTFVCLTFVGKIGVYLSLVGQRSATNHRSRSLWFYIIWRASA